MGDFYSLERSISTNELKYLEAVQFDMLKENRFHAKVLLVVTIFVAIVGWIIIDMVISLIVALILFIVFALILLCILFYISLLWTRPSDRLEELCLFETKGRYYYQARKNRSRYVVDGRKVYFPDPWWRYIQLGDIIDIEAVCFDDGSLIVLAINGTSSNININCSVNQQMQLDRIQVDPVTKEIYYDRFLSINTGFDERLF